MIKERDRVKMGKLVTLLLLLFALGGCDQKAWIDKFTPQEEVTFTKEYLALFRARNYEAIEAKTNPSVKDAGLRAKLEQTAILFPQEEPKDIVIVGSHVVNMQNVQQTNLTLQYEFANKWLLANIVLQKSGGVLLVNGVQIKPIKDSLENLNSFTFEGKGIGHYMVLGLAILVPALIVFALVLCIRTPIPKRKWLWILFILFGIFQLTINWTTGEFYFNPIYVQVLGSGFWKPLYGPLAIFISIPLGAIIFLLKRKQWAEQKRNQNPGTTKR